MAGKVEVDLSSPTFAEEQTAVEPLGFFSVGPKVKVPRNYNYHPKRGPDQHLHDYCTKSPDTWNIVTWRGPCALHDMCYQYAKYHGYYSKGDCDGGLKYNMKKQCRHYFSKYNPNRYTCYSVAIAYWAAVKSHTYFSQG